MALWRAGSTLSQIQHRANRYETYIRLASVFLVVISTITVFSSVVLIKWYFMPNLAFWDQTFVTAPYLMLALGIYTFIISIGSFAIAGLENRGLLIFFAALLGIAFICQIASIFLFWEVRTLIQNRNVGPSAVNEELGHYGQPGYESTTNAWDHMQELSLIHI